MVSISRSACSSGYRQDNPKASVIAWSAFGEGPYGFSFELRRTAAAGTGLAEVARGAGNATLGRAMTLAAPTPTRAANWRREIEFRSRMFTGHLQTSRIGCIMRHVTRETKPLDKRMLKMPVIYLCDRLVFTDECKSEIPPACSRRCLKHRARPRVR